MSRGASRPANIVGITTSRRLNYVAIDTMTVNTQEVPMGLMDKLKDAFGKGADKAKEGAEKAKPLADKAAEKAKPLADKAAEKAKAGADKAKEGADKAKERLSGDSDS